METPKIRAVVATQELINHIKANLREEDIREVRAVGRDPQKALQDSFDDSTLCWVAMNGDEPVCAFGVVPASLMGSQGIPWMLGTPSVKKIKRSLVEQSKDYIDRMAEEFEYLENWIDTRNAASKRWLQWCGFEMGSAQKYGVNGELFHRFTLETKKDIVSVLQAMTSTPGTVREKISRLEAVIASQPNAVKGDDAIFQVQHYFADGMYMRQITIPKGTLAVGEIHKFSHPSFIMRGDMTIVTEEGCHRVTGPCAMIAPAGTKRAGFAHEETVWVTVHATKETEWPAIKEAILAKSYEDFDQFIASRSLICQQSSQQ